jgi:hypothetical protein
MPAPNRAQPKLRSPLLRYIVGDLRGRVAHSSLYGLACLPLSRTFKSFRKRYWLRGHGPDYLEWDSKDEVNELKQEIVVR